MATAPARPYNTLVYTISDDRIHNFKQDVFELNRQLRNSLRDHIVQDLLTVVEDGDVLVVSSDHGFIELDEADAVDLTASRLARTQINYRYLEGERIEGWPSLDLGQFGRYTVAVGRAWFRRPGGHWIRYSHGGLSFSELLVPGAVFLRSVKERIEVTWGKRQYTVQTVEDEELAVELTLTNTGNRVVQYELQPSPSALATLDARAGRLAVRQTELLALRISAPPGCHVVGVTGRYGTDALDRDLPLLTVEVEVAERADRVEFSFDALDLLDKDLDA